MEARALGILVFFLAVLCNGEDIIKSQFEAAFQGNKPSRKNIFSLAKRQHFKEKHRTKLT